MRRCVFLITASFLVLFFSTGISSADPIRVEFSGVVTSYSHSGYDYPSAFVGDDFSGFFSYDNTNPTAATNYVIDFFWFNVVPGVASVTQSCDGILLDDTSPAYIHDLFTSDFAPDVDIDTVNIQANLLTGTGWIYIVKNSSTETQSSLWTLSSPGTQYALYGTINFAPQPSAVSAVPEPSTLMLILLTGPVLAVVAGLKKQTKKISHKA